VKSRVIINVYNIIPAAIREHNKKELSGKEAFQIWSKIVYEHIQPIDEIQLVQVDLGQKGIKHEADNTEDKSLDRL